jgi:hypothetical protein
VPGCVRRAPRRWFADHKLWEFDVPRTDKKTAKAVVAALEVLAS